MGGPNEQAECHLFRLPPELRLHIYDDVLGERSQIRINVMTNAQIRLHLDAKEDHRIGDAAALSRSCKFVYLEATPVLYASTEFMLNIFGRPASSLDSYAVKTKSLPSLRFLRRAKSFVLTINICPTDELGPAVNKLRDIFQVMSSHGLAKMTHLEVSTAHISSSVPRHSIQAGGAGRLLREIMDYKNARQASFWLWDSMGAVSKEEWQALVQKHDGTEAQVVPWRVEPDAWLF